MTARIDGVAFIGMGTVAAGVQSVSAFGASGSNNARNVIMVCCWNGFGIWRAAGGTFICSDTVSGAGCFSCYG